MDELNAPGDISASEDEGDQERHEKLLDAIAELDGKKRKRKELRIEPSLQVSEFNLATSGDNQINLKELVGILKNTGSQAEIRKKLKSAESRKVLEKPLNKLEQERVERSLGYEKNKKEVSKWLPIVKKNRKADQLHFPLEEKRIKLDKADKFAKFQPRTPLELEVAKMLHGSDHVLTKNRMLTKAEERALKAMNLEEARARRAELQKYRALLSYKEAKARRQNKIKSKKYHRVLRKEVQKKGRKALEDLKLSDPEAYAEKLKQLEKERIEERMSLKHRGGSKKMAKQMLYGKYNKEARDNVQEMIQKNKELTSKVVVESDSESDSGQVESQPIENKEKKTMFSPWTGSNFSGDNPWMQPVKAKVMTSYKRPEALVNTEAADEEAAPGDVASEDEEVEKIEVETSCGGAQGETEVHVVTFDSEAESSSSEVESAGDTMLDLNKLSSPAEESSAVKSKELSTGGNSKAVVSRNGGNSKPVVSRNGGNSKPVVSRNGDNSKAVVSRNTKGAKNVVLSDSDSEEEQVECGKNIDEIFEGLEKKNKIGDKKREKVVKTKKKKRRGKARKVVEVEDNESDSPGEDVEKLEVQDDGEELITGSLQRKRTLEEFGVWSDTEGVEAGAAKKGGDHMMSKCDTGKTQDAPQNKDISIDPKQVLTVETKIVNSLASNVVSDEENDGEDAQRMTISEAFVDDDVMEEFSKEKQAVIDREKPKDLNLVLPGWGDWGGEGIAVSKRKRKRFTLKAAPAPPRRDGNLDNVILSENKDASIAKHQVSQLPYEFNNVKQFESSIRAPLGKTWNPETAFRELTKPKVLTRSGTIITPMDESEKFTKQKGINEPIKNEVKSSQRKRHGHSNKAGKKK